VLARPGPAGAAPPGVDPERFRLALLEDTYEVLAGLALVRAAVVRHPDDRADLAALTWPGTPMPEVARSTEAGELRAAIDALATLGATEAVVVAPDAPDLPSLLLGKLFRGLGSAGISVCPAEGGGLVALAARAPAPDWLAAAQVGLDTADAVARLRAAAPTRRSVSVGPGWHRLRAAADIARLDPGLEGWEATRLLLSGQN
jgi:glycosyltransferase A (GT-A) superfamily protein (DUF2064 family)